MKKITYAIVTVLLIGILCFFVFPDPSEESTEITTTIATTTQATTSEPTTEAKVRINTREKASTTKVEVETTKKVVETTTKPVEKPTTTKVPTTKVQPTTKKATTTNAQLTTKKVITTKAQPTTQKVTTTKAQTTTKKVSKTYTESDKYLLAQIVYAEAGGCNKAEMAKVGQVVLNRVRTKHDDFKNCNTIREVLNQKGQYPQTVRKINNGIKPSQDAIEVAEGLLSGTLDSGLSQNVLWQVGVKMAITWDARVVKTTTWHKYAVPA